MGNWGRRRINVVKNAPPSKAYSTIDSFVSVGFTSKHDEAEYNNEADPILGKDRGYYCSQIVAFVLYKQGCAFTPQTNLNVDPWELYKALEWQYDYRSAYFSDAEAHDNVRQYTMESDKVKAMTDEQRAEAICKNVDDKGDCEAIDPRGTCSWAPTSARCTAG